MKTEDLIRALAADTQDTRSMTARMLTALVPALLVSLAALWLVLGFRADLGKSFLITDSIMRFALTGAVGLLGARIALVLARPEGRDEVRLWPLVAVAIAAFAVLVWAFVTTPSEGVQMKLVGKTLTTCMITIPLLSILPVAAIMWALRQGATTAPVLAGFVAGLGGSGMSAAIYALHCTEDSPLFYIPWYGLAIAGVTLVSTVIGARVLRW
ncbi:MAG: DUF1109 domain-containing protein [Rhodobacterales bacterium]|nr:DUF1109 domain-containing protein [Rhodobacterales bacterium]MDX5389861.1 DUF1109 domain-containing protein [Rhodobacterales bacterium]MDX5489552.1 DUF1109 domain-containing protein [Rhodobacterales bacterium]